MVSVIVLWRASWLSYHQGGALGRRVSGNAVEQRPQPPGKVLTQRLTILAATFRVSRRHDDARGLRVQIEAVDRQASQLARP